MPRGREITRENKWGGRKKGEKSKNRLGWWMAGAEKVEVRDSVCMCEGGGGQSRMNGRGGMEEGGFDKLDRLS